MAVYKNYKEEVAVYKNYKEEVAVYKNYEIGFLCLLFKVK